MMRATFKNCENLRMDVDYRLVEADVLARQDKEQRTLIKLIEEMLPAFRSGQYNRGEEIEKILDDIRIPF